MSNDIKHELVIVRGLNNKKSPRLNDPGFHHCNGCYPYQERLESLDPMVFIDASGLDCTFPYPQLFVLQEVIIVASASVICEYTPTMGAGPYSLIPGVGGMAPGDAIGGGGTFNEMLTGLPVGSTWEVLDYGPFVALTNGVVTVTRDPIAGSYSVSQVMPASYACGDYNGQAVIGSPTGEIAYNFNNELALVNGSKGVLPLTVQ